ncbi:MAG: hypothetical protein HON19_01175 [Flavobacteriales bacterium]|nr:hypothetical protein [Flavobacteriales bacterium]
MAIEINIDEQGKNFIISDETKVIRNNRRSQSYFSEFLNASFDGVLIIIPIPENEDKDILLRKVQKALNKYQIEQVESEKIKEILFNYFKEKENFKVFSQQAKGIWENEIDKEQIKEFKSALRIKLKNRTLYDKQMLAAFHLAFAHNACNFSVPGAGKTSVVYGAYAYLNNLPKNHPGHVNKLLIIGPLS